MQNGVHGKVEMCASFNNLNRYMSNFCKRCITVNKINVLKLKTHVDFASNFSANTIINYP